MRDLVLAIETSNPGAGEASDDARGLIGPGVALGRLDSLGNLEFLGEEPVVGELMVAVDRLFARLGHLPKELARVGVSVGPGGFTSVRIAVASAAMIAEATGCACVGVPSALVAARGAAPDGRPFAVALASKRDSAHVTVFDGTGSACDEGRIMRADELPAVARLLADRHLPAAFSEEAARRGVEVLPTVFRARACLDLSAIGTCSDPARLLPLYPREPEAVTRWRELRVGMGGLGGEVRA